MPVPSPQRVGLNAALLSLAPDYRAAGIHRYILSLLRGLSELEAVRVVAFTAEPRARQVLPPSIAVRPAPRWARGPKGRIVWEQTLLPCALARAGADVCHCPAYALPLAARVPVVVTVHDLSFFRLPETLPRAQAFYLRAATRVSARRAAALIAVSAFTARELREVLGVPGERIHVVPNGLEPDARRPSDDRVAAYRQRAQLPPEYVLAVGTLQPRKNLDVVLRAYGQLAARGVDAPPLLVAGAPGWGDTDVAAAAERHGVGRLVRLLGYVPPADLPPLYAAATALAYPSRYEGFGLPVLEAMACGTPVIAAQAASLPEVAGDAALLVAPDDAAAWADALSRLLLSPALRAACAAAGLRRSDAFTWHRTAVATAAVYGAALAGPRTRPALGPDGRG